MVSYTTFTAPDLSLWPERLRLVVYTSQLRFDSVLHVRKGTGDTSPDDVRNRDAGLCRHLLNLSFHVRRDSKLLNGAIHTQSVLHPDTDVKHKVTPGVETSGVYYTGGTCHVTLYYSERLCHENDSDSSTRHGAVYPQPKSKIVTLASKMLGEQFFSQTPKSFRISKSSGDDALLARLVRLIACRIVAKEGWQLIPD